MELNKLIEDAVSQLRFMLNNGDVSPRHREDLAIEFVIEELQRAYHAGIKFERTNHNVETDL